jgi:tetratricopeptide (TPR) repeat protein
VSQSPQASETFPAEEYQRLLLLLDERRFDEAQVRARVLLETGCVGPLLRAKVHNLLCWTFIEGLKRATPEAVLHGEESVRLAAALGERPLQVQAMCNLASACHQLGDWERSRQTFQELITHLNREPHLLPCGLVIAYQGLAQLDMAVGRYDQALDYLETARQICREEEGHLLLADIFRRQALVLLKLHRSEEAAQCLALINEESGAGPRSLWWKTHLAFTRARVELALGHWGQARYLSRTAFALARELNDMPVMAEATCLLALVDHAEGRKEAQGRARKALALAIHSGRRDVAQEIRERVRSLLAFEA